MKVFISWSKNSRGAGKAVSDAISEIFAPVVTSFISQDIRAGSRALEEIDEALDDTDFGIVCLTPSNQTEQWINYEAGALSRQVGDKRKRMGVLLIGFESVDEVNSPLNIFQCKMADLEGFTDLMVSLNELEPKINEETLRKRIASAWPDLNRAFEEIINETPAESLPVLPEKTTDDRLDELLNLMRALEATVGEELISRKNRTAGVLFKDWVRDRETDDEPYKIFISHAGKDFESARKLYEAQFSRRLGARDTATEKIIGALRADPAIGQVTIATVDGELRMRTDNIVPPDLMLEVIKEMSSFYPVEKIVFLPNSFRDESGEDTARA